MDAGRRLNGSVPAGQTTGSGQVELVAWNKPSVVADSFRLVLTSILFGDRHGSPRVIVLSSANPKEGKTTVISNLAVAIAEANQRVLLIDGDMRRPRIHEIFGVENGPGVADLLRELNPLDAASVKRLVRASGIPNLSLLTSGHSDLAAMNLVYSPRLEEAVHFLRQDYDIVLIDSPPALQMADARVLARCADAVILVVRAQRTMRDAAKLACERFAQDGTHIFGAILNDWEPQESPSYAYRKYYDHYHSYYGGKRE
ncbi:MAG: CpsD/CapB family tyrosine-protein kinase [Acidobacteria bacterium]|nr:CpsD/CapB family tyrosine-protein kinase [Acidobacteriota bacterium]